MQRTTLRLSDEEYAKILEYAKAKEQSINEVIRQVIRDWKPKC
jgi:predicted HicB family RNase H-like nuclease